MLWKVHADDRCPHGGTIARRVNAATAQPQRDPAARAYGREADPEGAGTSRGASGAVHERTPRRPQALAGGSGRPVQTVRCRPRRNPRAQGAGTARLDRSAARSRPPTCPPREARERLLALSLGASRSGDPLYQAARRIRGMVSCILKDLAFNSKSPCVCVAGVAGFRPSPLQNRSAS
jgi:hypothetical protein